MTNQGHKPAGSRDATGKKNGGQFQPAEAKPQGSIEFAQYGPNSAAVEAVLEKTKLATPEQAERLSLLWGDRLMRNETADKYDEWNTLRMAAFTAAVEGNRAAPWKAAEKVARNPYTGERCYTTRDAVTALVVQDLISPDLFDFLYAPWASVMEQEASND